MRLVEYITDAGCRKEQTVACFLDVEKAFDSVWHDGLLFKLREIQLPDCYLRLIASFLTERTFCVRIDDHVSSERRITAGVPQGSVLGPLLFSVYVNDAPREPGVQMALFADDTAVYTADRNADRAILRLQRALDAYSTWTESWKVAVNDTKSSAVLFSKRRKEPRGRVRLGRTYLPWSREVKYLGVHLDRRLTWRTHAETCLLYTSRCV